MGFKKGDPRTAELAKKGGSLSKRVPRRLAPNALDEIYKRGPAAFAALDELIADKDPGAIRMIVDRLAPKALVEDAEINALVTTLQDEIKTLTSANEKLEQQLDEAVAQIPARHRDVPPLPGLGPDDDTGALPSAEDRKAFSPERGVEN